MARRVHKKDHIKKHLQKSADCIVQFIKFSILTNTYEEARGWMDDNKSEFSEEFELVANRLIRSYDNKEVLWQADPFYFKWRLYAETFTPVEVNDKSKLI